MTITRREFELAARFVGVSIRFVNTYGCDIAHRVSGRQGGKYKYEWTPHLPSSDSCELLAKVEQYLTLPIQESAIPDSDVLIAMDCQYWEIKRSGDANQLCQAAFMLAVAIQEERESAKI